MPDKELRLQVVFAARDKLTARLKKIQAATTPTAKALKATADRLKELNKQQGAAGKFRELHAGLSATSGKLKAAQERVNGLAREMKATDNPSKEMTKNFERAQNAAKKLKEQFSQDRIKLQGLRDEMAKSGIQTGALRGAIANAGKGTANFGQHQRQLRSDIAATTAKIEAQKKQLAAIAHQQERMAAVRQRLHNTRTVAGNIAMAGVGMSAAGIATGMPVLKTVTAFMQYEDSMLGIAKQVDGARDANGKLTKTYHDMGRAMRNLATRIPMTTTELIDLTVAGARMGIQGKENLIAFAANNAKMATAFEMPAAEIGDQMGKIAGIFKIPIQSLDKLGDAINTLDDNAISKGADIISVLQGDLAGAASTIGLSAQNAAALASTLLTLGESPERADTAASGMMRQLQIARMNPERFQVGANMLGMSGRDLQMGMIKDAQGTILAVLDKINALPTESRMEAVTRLFGKDWGGAIAKLAGGVGEYRRQLELANGAAAKGSMDREFQARLDTLSAKWQILQNKVFGFSSATGGTLKPALTDIMETLGGVMERISKWIEDNPKLAGTLLKISAIVAVLLVSLGGLALGVAALLGPFAIMRFVLAGIGISGGLLMPILRGLGSVVMWLGRVFLMNPIGLAVTAIAVSALLIYKFWDPIKGFFGGMWTEIKQAFNGGLLGITALILNWSPLGLFYKAFAGVMRWFGVEMPAKFTDFGMNIMRGLVNGITGALGWVKNTITGAGESVIGWFKEKLGIHSPSRVFAELGDFTMQGLAIGLQRSEDTPIGQVSGLAKRLTQLGAGIAIGAAAMPAMAFDTRPPLAPRAAGSGMVIQGDTIQIIIQPTPGMDEHAIARAVAQALDQRDRQKAARRRSSLSDHA